MQVSNISCNLIYFYQTFHKMENPMHLWRGVDKLSYTFHDKPSGIISKLITVKDHIFIATTTNNLYKGQVSFFENSPSTLIFKRTEFEVIDISANSDYLFIINNNGHVLKVHPQDMSVVDTIILKEEVKCCSHGYKQEAEIIKVKSFAISDGGALFVTESGQLWASGNQSQIDINTTEPKKVRFFEGRTVFAVACGLNFNVVAVRKATNTIKDDTECDNELDEEVFVHSCPQCVSNILLNPAILASPDTCPVGFHAQQYRDEPLTTSISALSLTSKENNVISFTESNKKEHVPVTENGEVCSNNLTDSENEGKKNVIFINTEAARQFLSRQLSWVSSYGNVKEDIPQEIVDKPTKLIKQNVSNVANLVYEGVKNVGDKVVTLSRHMSGSSDINNDFKDTSSEYLEDTGEECIKPPASNVTLNSHCEEFPWSSSTASSEHELSQQGLNDRISSLTRSGSNILSTELWSWGDVQYGQLGTGDIIKRSQPVLVAKLSNTGLRKIACGAFHVLALTLDGRVFAWGRNNYKQVTLESNIHQSSPKLFTTQLSPNERAKDIAAGSFHSLVMMHHGLYFIGQSSKAGEMFHLDTETSADYSSWQIFSSGEYSCCSVINEPEIDISEDLVTHQIFLERILIVYQHLIKPFQKKGGAMPESNVYETLCRCYTELLSFTVLSVISLWDFLNHSGDSYEVVVIANVEEYIAVYKYYLNAVCDVISLSGFTYIAKIFEVPQIITNLFKDKLTGSSTKKISDEIIITTALQYPLHELSRYKNMVSNLLKCNITRMGVERLKESLMKWEQICSEQEKLQKEAEATKLFWENSGKLGESLRSPNRRLIRESRTHPLSALNSGRFSSHWFILLTDIFIHAIGTSYTVHPLQTLWVELSPDSETVQNVISIVAPEDTFLVYTPTPSERNEWFCALQNTITSSLQRVTQQHIPPIVRFSSFSFTKHSVFKDAKYTGRWLNGKPHGSGKLEWPDGRKYVGQFHKGVLHGMGKMEIPSQGVYDGHWKDGQQNGYGTMKYNNSDFYEGYFKDGLPHGHGIKKEGHFMASIASVYIGEWVAGVKQGYGIMDDIMTGEKYLGSWSNDMKHGCGLIVTLDGIYYEGVFMQDILTGHGVMVFEDGTHYEGEFKSAGIFYGKGTLTFRSGDRLEGNMYGAWNEGVKVIATLHMNKASGNIQTNAKPTSFGKLCVSPDQKWKSIFRQCYQQLGVTEPNSKSNTIGKSVEAQRVWQNVASIISKSHQKALQRKQFVANTGTSKEKSNEIFDELNKIPCFGRDKLTLQNYNEILKYLMKAFESPHHPLGALLTEVAAVYIATYGGVRVHPLLLSHAVSELHSITSRIYEIVTLLFPALPRSGKEYVLETENEDENQVISAAAILHPILLPRVHSALFVLYALHNKREDDAYWERLIKWNKQPDITLMAFLDIDQKFWKNVHIVNLNDNGLPYQTEPFFSDAIETLQQLKTTFSPLEKLLVVRNTFEQMTQAVQKQLGPTYLWTMDELFPVFCFVVARASVLQLGSEIHFIEDFMEPYLQNGELGIMFTTLKACYYQILQEKVNVSD